MKRDVELLVAAATSLIGTPFRLHGRDPSSGVDCVGILDWSLREIGRRPSLPRGYRLRNSSVDMWFECAKSCGLRPVDGAIRVGDIILVSPSPGQFHLMIAEASDTFIHAHAGLKKVVRERTSLASRPTKHWRLAPGFQD